MEVLSEYQLSHQQNQELIQKLEQQVDSGAMPTNMNKEFKSAEIANLSDWISNALSSKDNDGNDNNLTAIKDEELNAMLNQLVSLKQSLKEKEDKMMVSAAKQKKKYNRFVEKHMDEHNNDNDDDDQKKSEEKHVIYDEG